MVSAQVGASMAVIAQNLTRSLTRSLTASQASHESLSVAGSYTTWRRRARLRPDLSSVAALWHTTASFHAQ
eukprot:5357757-Heterocapsa_arctica.AAC.1